MSDLGRTVAAGFLGAAGGVGKFMIGEGEALRERGLMEYKDTLNRRRVTEDRDFRRREREAEQAHRTGERQAAQAYRSGERKAEQTHRTGEREAAQAYRTGERKETHARKSGLIGKVSPADLVKLRNDTIKAHTRKDDIGAQNVDWAGYYSALAGVDPAVTWERIAADARLSREQKRFLIQTRFPHVYRRIMETPAPAAPQAEAGIGAPERTLRR